MVKCCNCGRWLTLVVCVCVCVRVGMCGDVFWEWAATV